MDFSQPCDNVAEGVSYVSKQILQHGVTSFCPTLVTSPPDVYHKVLQPRGQTWVWCSLSSQTFRNLYFVKEEEEEEKSFISLCHLTLC